MTLNLKISPEFEQLLRQQHGDVLEREALEGVAIKWFNAGYISSRQVAQLLGMSLFAALEFLKANGGESPMTIEDVEKDLQTLRELK